MSDNAPRGATARRLVPALEHFNDLAAALSGGTPALFLDYDGTLAPIVENPEKAHLEPGLREVLQRLAKVWPTAIVSGRRAADVRERVGVEPVVVLGDHGLVWSTAREERVAPIVKPAHLSALDRVEKELEKSLQGVEGVWVERKQCTLTVHTRQVDGGSKPRVEKIVDATLGPVPLLVKMYGKEVLEVRPRVDWDKGTAVVELLQHFERERRGLVPIAIGDDVSDESVFEALQGRGVTVRVGEGEGSAAEYVLADPAQVLAFLRRLQERFL